MVFNHSTKEGLVFVDCSRPTMGRNNLLKLHYGAQASEYNHARQQIPSLWWKKNFKRENLVMPNFLHPESREVVLYK